ncbi:BRO-N domain-containing protein, partial [Beijerinckia mobilis]|uniref:BRO-N domain-containing protein n=1 Tax=Beijerinckia mobilis TaxID=231434 RepID=UPI00247803DD
MSQAKGQTDTSLQELVRQQIQFNEMTIRTILLDGVVWFIATDVCAALQIKKPNRALARLEDYEKGAHTVSTPGGEQKVLIINEAELYSLILTSRKPEAKAFKCWLTTEVLPSIRKTGRYDIHQEQALPGSEAQESVLREVFNDFGHWR